MAYADRSAPPCTACIGAGKSRTRPLPADKRTSNERRCTVDDATPLIAVPLVSTASGALVMTVEKARIKIDGTFVPVLVVTGGATSRVHRGGEDGWTMSILYDPKKNLWIGVSPATVPRWKLMQAALAKGPQT